MPFARRQRRYFKYGTELDANIVGSFGRIDKGIASGFSDVNFIKISDSFDVSGGKTWEMVYKITTGADIASTQTFCGFDSSTSNFDPVTISVYTSKFSIDLASSSSSAIADAKKGSHTVLANTTYYVKLVFNGSEYTLSYSFDGIDFIEDIKVTSSTSIYTNNLMLGGQESQGTRYSWKGSIDISQSYININGERWWSGDNYTKIGSWIEDGVVSGFNASSWLSLPSIINFGSNTWEVGLKFITGDIVVKKQRIFNSQTDLNGTMFLIDENGNFEWRVNVDNWVKHISSFIVSSNTVYWVKLKFDGSSYVMSYSTDGVDYIDEITINSTKSLTTVGYNIGASETSVAREPFLGSIDMNNCYINLDGKTTWHGTKVYQINVSDKDVYENWRQPILTSDGVLGGDRFAVTASSVSSASYPAYQAFDSNTSETIWLCSGNGSLTFYNPNPLKVSKLVIQNRNHASYVITAGTIEVSDDNATWTTLTSFTNSSTGANAEWEIDLSSNNNAYKYYKINGTAHTNEYTGIRNVKITAQQLMPTGTIEDADYHVDSNKLYKLVKSKRAYYKYGNEIDASVVGSFGMFTNGIASGFKVGTLLHTPDIIDTSSNTWERVIKITTGNDVTSGQSIFGTIPDYRGLLLRLANSKLYFYVSSNGSSWNVINGATSSLTLLGVMEYYIKVSFNGSQYLVDVSTDGIDYSNYITVASSTNITSGKISIGGHGVTETSFDTPFLGNIDLNETYIKDGNEIIWTGDSYKKIGSWIDKGFVGGFSSSSYIKNNKYFNVNGDWEFVVRTNLTSSSTEVGLLFSVDSGTNSGINFIIGPTLVRLAFNHIPNQSWTYTDIAMEVPTDRWFYIKYVKKGTLFTFYFSDDGESFEEKGSYTFASTLYDETSFSFGATSNIAGVKEKTLIDFNKSYIKINGQEWWHGTKVFEINTGSDNVYEYWKQPALSSNSSSPEFKVSATNEGQGEAWKAFDANNQTHWCTANNTPSGTLTAILDKDIYITSIEVTGLSNQHGYTNTITIYSDPNKQNIIGEQKTFDYSKSNTLVWNFDEPVKVNSLAFYATGSNWVCIYDIKITAKQLMNTGSIEEADFYKNKLTSYLPILRNARHFVTLFESTAAGTYDVNIPNDCTARVTLVGGGGAAAMLGRYDDRGYGWTGGSGGAFIGNYELEAGTYSVTVGSANNNTKGQGGNTNTMNPDDTSTHDSYITGLVRVGGGGAGTTSGVGAAGASATFEVEPISVTLNSTGNAGAYGSGGKGSGANWTHNGAESVYNGYGKGQGCSTSEYASRRYWISGTDGYARIEIMSLTEKQLY